MAENDLSLTASGFHLGYYVWRESSGEGIDGGREGAGGGGGWRKAEGR